MRKSSRLFSTSYRNLLTNKRWSAAAAAPKEPQKGKTFKEKPVKETSSFVMNLYRGVVNVNEIFPYPEVLDADGLSSLRMIDETSDRFIRENNDASKSDQLEKMDEKVLQGLKEMGFLGLQVPPEYGGLGLSNTEYARLAETVAYYELGTLVSIGGAHQSIGFKGIVLYGTEEQKRKYLPDLAAGKKLAAYCLTEPTSGSDAQSIRTRAELSKDGKHYILNGGKIWITNGGLAEVFTVFAKTPVEVDGVVKDKISAFIVERSPGVTSGPPEQKMGIKCSNTTEVHFDNVKVPKENLLGKEGDGFKVAVNILNNGRFGMPAALSGTMRFCIQKAIDHVSTREQFGRMLGEFEGIREKIARMVLAHYVCESLCYALSGAMDKGSQDYQLEAAVGKIYSSEAAWWVCDEAIQVLGGMGYMRSAEIERVLRDLRIFRIFEGASDTLRLFIALTGCQFAGGHLRTMSSNVGFLLGAVGKKLAHETGLNRFSTGPGPLKGKVHSNLESSAQKLSNAVERFGLTVQDLLRKHGKGIIEEQNCLMRLSDATIDIYCMATVLSRASRSLSQSVPSAAHEEVLARLFCNMACERVDRNLGVVKSGEWNRSFKEMSQISKDVCAHKGIIHQHPLGF